MCLSCLGATLMMHIVCGSGAIGSASASQAEGCGFESRLPLELWSGFACSSPVLDIDVRPEDIDLYEVKQTEEIKILCFLLGFFRVSAGAVRSHITVRGLL